MGMQIVAGMDGMRAGVIVTATTLQANHCWFIASRGAELRVVGARLGCTSGVMVQLIAGGCVVASVVITIRGVSMRRGRAIREALENLWLSRGHAPQPRGELAPRMEG